jgi:hypothetical protein
VLHRLGHAIATAFEDGFVRNQPLPLTVSGWRADFTTATSKAPITMRLAFAPALAARLISAATNPAMAESPLLRDRDACWERVYDDAHLKAHPEQRVVQIRLFHPPSRWRSPAASPNGAPVVGVLNRERMDRSSSAAMTSRSIRPHLPGRSGRKML